MLQPMEEPIQLFGTWCAGAEGGSRRHQTPWTSTQRVRSTRLIYSQGFGLSPGTHPPATPSYFPVLGDGPDHAHSHGDVHDPVFGRGRLHQRPGTSYPAPEDSAGGPISERAGRRWAPSPRTRVRLPTFGIVPVDSFPDQRLPLPQRDPQEVVGPTADLDRLPRGIHERP